jgi:hypothetical protein
MAGEIREAIFEGLDRLPRADIDTRCRRARTRQQGRSKKGAA